MPSDQLVEPDVELSHHPFPWTPQRPVVTWPGGHAGGGVERGVGLGLGFGDGAGGTFLGGCGVGVVGVVSVVVGGEGSGVVVVVVGGGSGCVVVVVSVWVGG